MGTIDTDESASTRLDRAKIIDAALRIAECDGLTQVTIRAVAARLGVAPMSLYRHVKNKTQLFDLMLEHVVQMLAPPAAPGATWQHDLVEAARHARDFLRAHPEWHPLLPRLTARTLAFGPYERISTEMTKEQVSPSLKMDALASLVGFTLGFVLVERTMQGEIDFDRAFEFGVEALVAGIRREDV